MKKSAALPKTIDDYLAPLSAVERSALEKPLPAMLVKKLVKAAVARRKG